MQTNTNQKLSTTLNTGGALITNHGASTKFNNAAKSQMVMVLVQTPTTPTIAPVTEAPVQDPTTATTIIPIMPIVIMTVIPTI